MSEKLVMPEEQFYITEFTITSEKEKRCKSNIYKFDSPILSTHRALTIMRKNFEYIFGAGKDKKKKVFFNKDTDLGKYKIFNSCE